MGSKRWFLYRNDFGSNFWVELDEATYESPALRFTFNTGPRNSRVVLARNDKFLEMRYVRVSRRTSQGATIYRKFFVGQPSGHNIAPGGTLTLLGQVWNVHSLVGEVRKRYPVTDTALG